MATCTICKVKWTNNKSKNCDNCLLYYKNRNFPVYNNKSSPSYTEKSSFRSNVGAYHNHNKGRSSFTRNNSFYTKQHSKNTFSKFNSWKHSYPTKEQEIFTQNEQSTTKKSLSCLKFPNNNNPFLKAILTKSCSCENCLTKTDELKVRKSESVPVKKVSSAVVLSKNEFSEKQRETAFYLGYASSTETSTQVWNTSIYSNGPLKKKKKKKVTGTAYPTLQKNAVCLLNEMKLGLNYKLVEAVGPVHCPMFTMAVEVNGQVFKGKGRNKKLAKQAAAEAALASFIQFPDDHHLLPPPGSVPNAAAPTVPGAGGGEDVDFACDITDTDISMYNAFKNVDYTKTKESNGGGGEQRDLKLSTLIAEKSPVMVLNDLRPGKVKYECVSSEGEVFAKFTMTVTVEDKVFEGTGPSKKVAKAAAARSALSALFDVNLSSAYATPSIYAYPTRLAPQVPCQILPSHKVDAIAR